MFATCINCRAPLGRNEAIEHFPVGRRLAFDSAKGRLWVVCRVCRQWNLTPLEERWEAIDEGERWFERTRLRVSTDNVGLARLPDGTEIIRIGAPKRPEFAAWRYGERFTRRWMINAPAAAVGTAGLAVWNSTSGALVSIIGVAPFFAIAGAIGLSNVVRARRIVARLRLDRSREPFLMTQGQVDRMRFVPDERSPDGWRLHLPRTQRWSPLRRAEKLPDVILSGAEAVRVAGRLLPRVNRLGGRRGTVAEAVKVLERYGDAASMFRKASRYDPESRKRSGIGGFEDVEEAKSEDEKARSGFVRAPAPIRLAVEMAANEEQERELIAGELAALTEQWREAEEIAAIADSLTMPPAVLQQLERLRLR